MFTAEINRATNRLTTLDDRVVFATTMHHDDVTLETYVIKVSRACQDNIDPSRVGVIAAVLDVLSHVGVDITQLYALAKGRVCSAPFHTILNPADRCGMARFVFNVMYKASPGKCRFIPANLFAMMCARFTSRELAVHEEWIKHNGIDDEDFDSLRIFCTVRQRAPVPLSVFKDLSPTCSVVVLAAMSDRTNRSELRHKLGTGTQALAIPDLMDVVYFAMKVFGKCHAVKYVRAVCNLLVMAGDGEATCTESFAEHIDEVLHSGLRAEQMCAIATHYFNAVAEEKVDDEWESVEGGMPARAGEGSASGNVMVRFVGDAFEVYPLALVAFSTLIVRLRCMLEDLDKADRAVACTLIAKFDATIPPPPRHRPGRGK